MTADSPGLTPPGGTEPDRPTSVPLRQLPRLDAELGALDLFARLDEGAGSLSDPSRVATVIDRFRQGVERSLAMPSRVYGWHLQSMFSEVALALGALEFLKEEDQGATWVEPTDDVRPADYLAVLKSGERLLIEVKNFAQADPRKWFSIPTRALDGLQRYADVVGGRPVVAVSWAAWGIWTLLGLDRFERTATRSRIRFAQAVQGNEMGIIGDRMIGTVPPLEFRMDFDEIAPRVPAADGESYQATLRLTAVALSAGGMTLTTEAERRLMFYLVLNGPWPESKHFEEEEGAARHIRLVFEPEEWQRKQGFAFLGWYSQLFARAYWLRTSSDGEVTRLRAQLDPGAEGFVIPAGYESEALPLWRFKLQPTPIDEVRW